MWALTAWKVVQLNAEGGTAAQLLSGEEAITGSGQLSGVCVLGSQQHNWERWLNPKLSSGQQKGSLFSLEQ